MPRCSDDRLKARKQGTEHRSVALQFAAAVPNPVRACDFVASPTQCPCPFIQVESSQKLDRASPDSLSCEVNTYIAKPHIDSIEAHIGNTGNKIDNLAGMCGSGLREHCASEVGIWN
jgi:hypothetical protein